MSTLPSWITPRFMNAIGILYEELLQNQYNAVISFANVGLNLLDNNSQQYHISLDELMTNGDFMEGAISIPILDFSTYINVSEDEFKEVETISEPGLLSTLKLEEIEVKEETSNNYEELVSSVNQIFEEKKDKQLPEIYNDGWPKRLKEAMMKIFDQSESLVENKVRYYRLGEVLHHQPQKYRRQLIKMGEEICKFLGQNYHSRYFTVAARIYRMFANEKVVRTIKVGWTLRRIRLMSEREVRRFIDESL